MQVRFEGSGISENRHGEIVHLLEGVAVGHGPGRWPNRPDQIHITKRLAGGRSGGEVFEAIVTRGHGQSRKVIKLGPLHDLRNEFNAFCRHLSPPPSARFVPIEAVSERLLDEKAAPLEREIVVYNHAAQFQGGGQSATRTFEELAREAIGSNAALAEAEEALHRLFDGIRSALYDRWEVAEERATHRAYWNQKLGFDAIVTVNRVDTQQRRLETTPGPPPLYSLDVAKRVVSADDDRRLARILLRGARTEWWGDSLVAETAGPHFLRVQIESAVDGVAIRHLAGEVKDGEEWTIAATVQSWRHHHRRDRLPQCLGDEFKLADGRLSGPGASVRDPLAALADVMDAERAGRVTCVAHGDLNPRNILLVDRDVCLIDYALTGDGQPLVADFVRLEGCLVMDVLSGLFTWPELVRLQRYLAVACRLQKDDAADEIARRLAAEGAQLGRAFRLLWAVRRAARDVAPEPMRSWWDRDYQEQLFLFAHQTMKWLAPDNPQTALASAAISGVAAESLRLDRVFDLWPAETIRDDARLILSLMRGQAEPYLAELASLGRRLATLDLKVDDPLWREFREVRGELVRARFAEAARRIRERLEADHDVFINLKAYIDLKGQFREAARRHSRAVSMDEMLISDEAMAERERLRAEKDRPGEDALDLIADHPALVLLGDAGAGKSTIAREWEYRLARAILEETDGDPEPRLPVVVRASDVAGRLDDWTKDASAEHTAAVVEYALEFPPLELFEAGAATVVVDALNELADADKQRVAEWVIAFRERFPLTPLLVCHRQYNYPAGLLPFPIVTLEKVERQQAERYIRDYLREKLDESRAGAADPAEMAQALIHLLLESPEHEQVRDLAQTPLFLWMIVERYRQKRELPENRARLFGDFSRWYLEERHHTDHEEPRAAQYEYEVKADLLGRLGYELVQRGATGLPEAEIDELVRSRSRKTSDAADEDRSPATSATDILEEIIAAELLHREGGRLRFLHQSFQEYFAARHFLEHLAANPDEVRRRVLDFGWHDTFVLVLGFGGDNPEVVRQVVETALAVNPGLTARCLRMAETDDRSLLNRFVEVQQAVLGDDRAGEWAHEKAAAALADYGRGPARRALWTIAADPAAPETARCRSLEQLARLPEQARFETVAERIRAEFVERLPGVFDEKAPTAVQRAAIEAAAHTELKDLSGYLIDLLTGGEWALRRAAWEACHKLGLSLTPRQRDAYSTACAEQLDAVERELYEETVIDRMEELNDQRVAILEQLATPANLPLLLRRRFAYIVERWDAKTWDDRVAELIDGLTKDSPVGQASSLPSRLKTSLTEAWTILTEQPEDQPTAVARWFAAFRGSDELAALAAAHRLLAVGKELPLDEVRGLLDHLECGDSSPLSSSLSESRASQETSQAKDQAAEESSANGPPQSEEGGSAATESGDESPHSRVSALARIVAATEDKTLVEPLDRLVRSLIDTVTGREAVEALTNLVTALRQLDARRGNRRAAVAQMILRSRHTDASTISRFPWRQIFFCISLGNDDYSALLTSDETDAHAAVYWFQGYGGGITFSANRNASPVELSPAAQERLRELAEGERDPQWQSRFANAAVKSHAVTLLGWLLKTANSPELAGQQGDYFHATYGLVQERYLADFLRSIGYLTRRLLDEKKPDEARAGVEFLEHRKSDWLLEEDGSAPESQATEDSAQGDQATGDSAQGDQATTVPDRSIIVGLVTALGYLGDWEPILTQLGPGEPWLHAAARNVFQHWVPGPLAENPDGERQRAAEWITERLRRTDLAAEVRSTLDQVKADLEQKLGHHIWLGEG